MPLEGDMSVVLVVQVDSLVGGPRGAHHGDKAWGVGALLGVGGLALVSAAHRLEKCAHEPTWQQSNYQLDSVRALDSSLLTISPRFVLGTASHRV